MVCCWLLRTPPCKCGRDAGLPAASGAGLKRLVLLSEHLPSSLSRLVCCAGLELDPSNAQMKQGLADARAAAAPPPPRPSGAATSFSPYSSAPLARQPGPSGELVLMLAHLVLIVSAVLTVQPLSRRLSWQAYFLFCRTALVAGAYKVRCMGPSVLTAL